MVNESKEVTSATEFMEAEKRLAEKTQILEESIAEAKEIIKGEFPTENREDIFNSEVTSPDAIAEVYKERGKKYVDNSIKVCITMPYLIKTNQEMLEDHMKKYDSEENLVKKQKIAEDVFTTITQIKQLTAQIDAHKNISGQYVDVLGKLQEVVNED